MWTVLNDRNYKSGRCYTREADLYRIDRESLQENNAYSKQNVFEEDELPNF